MKTFQKNLESFRDIRALGIFVLEVEELLRARFLTDQGHTSFPGTSATLDFT